jgi:hypothetical protein
VSTWSSQPLPSGALNEAYEAWTAAGSRAPSEPARTRCGTDAWNGAARDGSALPLEDAIAYAPEEPPGYVQTHGELPTQRLGIAEKGGTKSSATACAFVCLRDDRQLRSVRPAKARRRAADWRRPTCSPARTAARTLRARAAPAGPNR